MEVAARFCKRCGTAFGDDSAHFCKRCGAPRSAPADPESPPARKAVALTTPGAAAGSARRAAGAARLVAGGGVAAAGLPWQTIVAGGPIDAATVLRGAVPAATRALSRSLRRPALILAFTIAVSFAVALLAGGVDSLIPALPQLLTGAVASVLALLARKDGSRLRAVAGVVSVAAAIVALVSLGVGLVRGIDGGESLVAILPLAIAMASSALAAGKTAFVALRRSG